MGCLRNPEVAWSRATTPATIDRVEVERRIGPTSESIEVLGGGLRNLNVRVGRDRVLRIERDPSTLAKELTLLRRPWRSFRTPAVLAIGDDFLVLEFLPLAPLPPSAGAAVGRALAEIHATMYPEMGLLAGDLSIAKPIETGVGGYVRSNLAEAEPFIDPALAARVRQHLEVIADEAALAVDGAVLTHSDFKVSNLHVTPTGELVVLDWEFSWAGLRLLDVGQLLRWHPPESFVTAFADSYRDAGGVLVDGWRRIAATIDLGNLLALLAHNSIARTSDEVLHRIVETLDD
jgi:fructosamine-3-kinase